MESQQSPILKDIVLVGGGHSHVAVLKRFAMRRLPGVRLTLVSRDLQTPYSGMLPGYIAGHYSFDESHIDLQPLARFAGARLIHDSMTGLDLSAGRIICANRPPVPYDVLSIDVGSTPGSMAAEGAAEHALPVKPVDRFLAGWREIEERVRASDRPLRIAVVGGGAGGVELALSLQNRLRYQQRGNPAHPAEFVVLTDSPEILPTHNAKVRRRFEDILTRRGIAVRTGHRVVAVDAHQLHCAHGGQVLCDAAIWVTQAAAPHWLAETGLQLSDDGFILVDDRLQSLSHPNVFAAGDVATMVNHPRPKSGVMAVRQGPPLSDNLRRSVLGRPLKRFRPQRHFLSLISTGDRFAVASRGRLALQGAWMWRWKDHIDRKWMSKYRDLPEMAAARGPQVDDRLGDEQARKQISALAMRCGGCGSKVGSTVLSRVLNQLQPVQRDDVLVGLNDPDDAAVVEVPAGKVMVHTVDFFRSFVDDAYIFGRIAANHALGDIYAMGAEPQTALALTTLPFGLESKTEQLLADVIGGAMEVLSDAGAALVGGHTNEGQELAFGLAVNGLAERSTLMRKGGMQSGDALVLTKALGTGTIFAADMRAKARGGWVDAAVTSMLQSNKSAAECLHSYAARACTDVTGFGLLGHLVEMTRPSRVDAELFLESLPVLDGARESLAQGIFSSLQPENIRLRRAISNLSEIGEHPLYPLLFDPQTAGGLLASIPAEKA
ncbi:MAG TPA: selenide, water dikinase SelD, partial [Gammaproteobacteria bacterium]|nr:selenide, water dikinase SelD [Gammaproteobacteria bacterium]